MRFVIITLCLLTVAGFDGLSYDGAPKPAADDSLRGIVTLKYDISPGDRYSYNLVTDQVVVNNHSTRMQTTFELTALSRDERGNTRCKIKLASNPIRDTSSLHEGDKRKKRFAGYRSFVQEQAYEAVLDALGRILTSNVLVSDGGIDVSEESGGGLMSKRATQYTDEPEENPATPELINFILPTTSALATIKPGAVWIDTFTVGSRTQFAPAIRPGQTLLPVLVRDSLFRTSVVDSVTMRDGRQQCYITMRTERHNAGGSKLVAISTMQRDVQTGLVVALHEKAYRVDDDDEILHYTASAVLVPESSTLFTAKR